MSTDPKLVSKEELFKAKESRRRELAALPIEEKIELLVEMQRWECDINRHTGRVHQKPWNITKIQLADKP